MLKVKVTQPQVSLTMDLGTADVLLAIVKSVSVEEVMKFEPMTKEDTEAIISNIMVQLEAI